MKIMELLPKCKVHGRTVSDNDVFYMNWTCSGLTLRFHGKTLKVKVLAESDLVPGMPGMPQPPADWPCLGAAVGNDLIFRHECLEAEQWLTVYESEEEKTVDLRLVKLSENARGKLGIAEIETDGEFLDLPCEKTKTIEFVGDSITCGFGNESPRDAFAFHTSEENGWITYASLAAKELGYDWSVVAESGIQAAKPEHPFMPMHAMEDIYAYTDELYDKKHGRELAKWDFEANHNDYVVLNLGTNDANPIRFYRDFNDVEGMELWFHDRYKEFVKQVRALNGPDTVIICSLGSIDYYLYHRIRDVVDELKKETGDEKLYSFEFIPVIAMMEGFGAAGHPSAKSHERMGRELAAFIRKIEKE